MDLEFSSAMDGQPSQPSGRASGSSFEQSMSDVPSNSLIMTTCASTLPTDSFLEACPSSIENISINILVEKYQYKNKSIQ